ncbi:MAG: ABC transporter ATP-binding protein [Chlamydiia bacterium]|nr:ABC transporter ATP-binding protein [Chlamydiia bacterium]
MIKKRKEYTNNIYNIIFKRKVKDLVRFFLISTPGSLAAFMEGISFSFLLLSLYILNGRGLEIVADKPLLSRLADIEFLKTLTANQLFLLFVFLAIGSQILKSVIIFLSNFKAAKLHAKILARIQQNIYEHILSFDFQTVSRYKTGDLASYAQMPTGCVVPILQGLHTTLIQSCVLIILLCFLMKISAILTLFFFLFFLGTAFAYKKLVSMISRYSHRCANQAAAFVKEVVQAINGIKLVHVFGMQDLILKKSHSILNKIQYYQQRSAKLQHLLVGLAEVFSMVMMGVTLLVSSIFLVSKDQHSLPLLLTYLAIAYRFTTTSRDILNQLGIIASQYGSIARLNKILKPEDKTFEPKIAKEPPTFSKALNFKNVSFTYPTKESSALDQVSFTFPKGKMTAIVGLSGAGKSTLINLITRLFSPTSGQILVDGVDLSTYSYKGWRSQLGVVTQNTIIFNDSAKENICFGTKATDEEVLNVARTAGCYEMIQNLPKGLDSLLGEHGYKISGGEAQRIAIARALIRKPSILILDEATSNLDSHNERIIHQTMESFRKESTLIVIAHRLSTIIDADHILVLDKGTLIEEGTHETLVKQGGRYAYLWNLQSKKRDATNLMQELTGV